MFLYLPRGGFRGEIGDTSLEDNQTKFFLLGVDTGHKIETLAVEVRDSGGELWCTSPNQRVSYTTDIAVVAPIWGLLDRLQEQPFVENGSRGERWQPSPLTKRPGDSRIRRTAGVTRSRSTKAVDRSTRRREVVPILSTRSRTLPSVRMIVANLQRFGQQIHALRLASVAVRPPRQG